LKLLPFLVELFKLILDTLQILTEAIEHIHSFDALVEQQERLGKVQSSDGEGTCSHHSESSAS